MSANKGDRILIEGLRCQAHVGVTVEERRRRQRLLLDLTLATPLARAGQRDDLTATVDYARAAALAKRIAEGRPAKLVEAIAERVAAALLR
ncbi:MAG: dihydroneopterin aldolase [Candidatus Omnitrophica bacterium]|nr:dihydroneopterin aldolase [Candidatus Omnitrophota bacterium]